MVQFGKFTKSHFQFYILQLNQTTWLLFFVCYWIGNFYSLHFFSLPASYYEYFLKDRKDHIKDKDCHILHLKGLADVLMNKSDNFLCLF